MRFEWDPAKERTNARRHGVTFAEASTAFLDDFALCLPDPEHSEAEDRFLLLGVSEALRFLVVCHTFRRREDVVRILSARRASPAERRQYELRRRR